VTRSAAQPPRAQGSAFVSAKRRDAHHVIDTFRCQGASKVLFPQGRPGLEAIVLNTSGGLTGGDRFSFDGAVGTEAWMTVTSQAAERGYRADTGVARVTNHVRVAESGRLHWLPQELILFDGAALERRLTVDLSMRSELLLVEPVLFGRAAMGERIATLFFHDQVRICRDGLPLYTDAMRFGPEAPAQLAQLAGAKGSAAMANLVYVAPDAEARLTALRPMLPALAGASLLHPDLIAVRVLAEDGFALRQVLLPLLDMLSGGTLPISWRL